MHEARLLRAVAALAGGLLLAAGCSLVNAPDEPGSGGGSGGGTTDCGRPLDTLEDCGACGVLCEPAHASGATCAGGQCAYASCVAGFLDCDGESTNGCEVNGQIDAAHCGGCGNACGSEQSCAAGQCTGGCAPNELDCNGTCVDPESDPLHCGDCTNACPAAANADPACVAGACALSCQPGFDDCIGGPADGCETSVSSDIANCGGCGVACSTDPNSTIECVSGQCTITACAPGWEDCNTDAADGCEADLASTTTCGDCTTSCAPGEGCIPPGQCLAGVFAFGEFRPALKCADFANHGSNYQQYCFQLKGSWYCTGQTSGGAITCADTSNGIKFTYDWGATWPMRFTPNTPSCMNYHPAYIQNFALAIGYANYTIGQTKSGNSCTRTWLDANGSFQQTGGDTSQALIYEVDFFN